MTASLPVESAFPEPGKLFAERYQIEGLIGKGGHSRVFRALQRGFDREVAVKVLNVERSVDRETRETIEKRFYREARLLSRLQGPNTLRVYDYGRTESGQLFMVSELVGGTNLEALLRNHGPLGERRARRIFTEVLQGLLEVHAEGFLHRDIKPSNIMVFDHLGERDRVKLLDFGIAKGMARGPDETGLTLAGFVIGTPGYMSPEQAFGRDLLEASDIFNAGLVAYEMLVGRAPYVGLSLEQVQRSFRSGSPRLPGTLDIDPEFAAVVHRCMEIDPDARYASVAVVLRDLGIAPDTTEIRAPDRPKPASNVLTFPMHVDSAGTTQIDTLTDAQTGQTTSILLPDTGPLENVSTDAALDFEDELDAEATLESPPSRTRVTAALIVIGLLIVAAIAVWALWSVVSESEQSAVAPSVPSPHTSLAPAVDAAAEIVVRSARNAELDATIAAKEAVLTEDADGGTETMEFEEPDEPSTASEIEANDPEPKRDVRRPRKRRAPKPKPKVNPKSKWKPKPEPEPEPEEAQDFDVKMLDEM